MKKFLHRALSFIVSLALVVFLSAGMTQRTFAAASAPKSITLNKKSVTLAVGEKVTLKVQSVKPKEASKKVTWQSSDKKIASVSSKGVVKALKAGTVKITARAAKGKAADSCKVTVKNPKETKVLIAYFSATGTTKGVAKKIAKATGGTLFEIMPKDPYSAADLEYSNDDCRANREMENAKARPKIKTKVKNMEAYQIVFLGFPIWWGTAPRIMDTFVEKYSFTGKTVIPFCTSGSSSIGTASAELKKLCRGNPTWKTGRRFEGDVPQSTVSKWVDSLGISKTEPKKGQEMNIQVTDGTHTVLFTLNSTPAAKSLFAQLPLTVTVEDYSDNEKIFYPKKLKTANSAAAKGGKGVLAYFSPWGDVVMYYAPFGPYPGLYALGEAVSGADEIQFLSGTITVTAAKQ